MSELGGPGPTKADMGRAGAAGGPTAEATPILPPLPSLSPDAGTAPLPYSTGTPDAGDTLVSDGTPLKDDDRRKRSRTEQAASQLLDREVEVVRNRIAAGAALEDSTQVSDREFRLFKYGQLKNGYSEETFDPPIELILKTTDIDGKEVKVQGFTEIRKAPDGKSVVICQTGDDTNPTVEIARDVLTHSYLQEYAGTLTSNFSGVEQKAVGLYAGIPGSDLTDDELTKLEDSLDSQKIAAEKRAPVDTVIRVQMGRITQDIQGIQAKDPKTITAADEARLLKLNQEQAHWKLAQQASRGELGVILQRGTLSRIAEHSTESTSAINNAVSATENAATLAKSELTVRLTRVLGEGGEAQAQAIVAALEDPSQLADILSNQTLINKIGPVIIEGFFGKDTTQVDVDTMFDNIIDANNQYFASLPPSLRDKIVEFATTDRGRKLGILALIVAAVPLVFAGAAAAAGAQMLGGGRH